MKSMFGVFGLAFATTLLGGVVYLTGAAAEGGLAVKEAKACHTPQDCIGTPKGYWETLSGTCIPCMSNCNCYP